MIYSINAQHNNTLHRVPLWWVSWFIYCYAECRDAWWKTTKYKKLLFFRNLTKTSLIPFWSGTLCIPVTIEVLSFLSKLKNWNLFRWTLNPVTNSIKHFGLNSTLLGYNGAENYWAILIHSSLIFEGTTVKQWCTRAVNLTPIIIVGS